MFVYIVIELIDYSATEIVAVFTKEEDAKNYVKQHYWKDSNGWDGISYEKHEVK